MDQNQLNKAITRIIEELEANRKPGKYAAKNAGELLPTSEDVFFELIGINPLITLELIRSLRQDIIQRTKNPQYVSPFQSRAADMAINGMIRRMQKGGKPLKWRGQKIDPVPKMKRTMIGEKNLEHWKRLASLLAQHPKSMAILDPASVSIIKNAINGKTNDPISKPLGEYIRQTDQLERVVEGLLTNQRERIPVTEWEKLCRFLQVEKEKKWRPPSSFSSRIARSRNEKVWMKNQNRRRK